MLIHEKSISLQCVWNSREILTFTGVDFLSCSLQYEFRENTYIVNCRKKNCFMSSQHTDPNKWKEYIFCFLFFLNALDVCE